MTNDAKSNIEEGTRVYRPGGFHPVYIGDVFHDRYSVLRKVGYGVYSTKSAFKAPKVLSAECYNSQQPPIFEQEILNHLRNGARDQLGYNHVCHLVDDFEHSDIKPDNIFVKFRDYSLIESGYLVNVDMASLNRCEAQYTVIPSTPLRNYYFNEADRTRVAEFDITLGDWGVSSWTDRHLSETIQPVALRSPEVLIQAPWDKSTDWWNLGAVLLEVFRAVRMFREHLAEIVDLFGPFPREFLEKGHQEIVSEIFDRDGRVNYSKPMNRPGLASEAFLPGLDQDVRDEFASFLHALMKINPAERVSAEDLLRHPWLEAL
ncbi:kinase-like domain-containing protein [Aspergillus californicus]